MITKDELQRYLTDYRAERDSINEMLRMVAEEVGAEYYPPATNYEEPVIQHQPNIYAQIDALLMKCEAAQKVQRKILYEARCKTEILDAILYAVWNLPARLRQVVAFTFMGSETVEDFAKRCAWSTQTVVRDRGAAVNRVYMALTKQPIGVWHADNETDSEQLGAI